MTLIGYLNALSAQAGESVDCMISSTEPDVDIDLIRLLHGDANPAGPGTRVVELDRPVQRVVASEQATHLGSCVVADIGPQRVHGTQVSVLFQPTTPLLSRRQGILSLGGEDRRVSLSLGPDGALGVYDGEDTLVEVDVPWRRSAWYRAEVDVDLAGEGTILTCSRVEVRHGGPRSTTEGRGRGPAPSVDSYTGVVIGAETCRRESRRWIPGGCFNGKIENPVLRRYTSDPATPDLVADWRFEASMQSTDCVDVGDGDHHGTVVNAPLRAATGHAWRYEVVDHRLAPEQYGAIHFHDDDLADAGWDVTTTVDLPSDLPSGVYGIRLRSGRDEDVVPFAVTPGPDAEAAPVVVLLPTFTYVAYANERMMDRLDFEGEHLTDHPVEAGWHDRLLAEHPEWGLSLYDKHSDGSTCAYSTHLRPVPNLRPDYRAWLQNAPRHLGADLYLVDWLTHIGQAFDVMTDHDVSANGPSALDPYAVVITGSHPEYVSDTVLDALDAHLDRGGSLMYLGGNGFYWVTSQDPDRPEIVEVRRGASGTRPSEGAPGQGVHSTTGETGGLWRDRGRGPNQLTGVGMTAQGWDEHAPGYRRQPDSYRPEAAFLFEGVDAEIIGDFGLIMNGSSGDELDRFDPDRGSPEDTLVLARSTGHSDYYQLAGEDLLATRPRVGGTECDDVRSDMTLLPHAAGGYVFSVGSICFSGAISHRGYDNDVARILGNALVHFKRRQGGTEVSRAGDN